MVGGILSSVHRSSPFQTPKRESVPLSRYEKVSYHLLCQAVKQSLCAGYFRANQGFSRITGASSFTDYRAVGPALTKSQKEGFISGNTSFRSLRLMPLLTCSVRPGQKEHLQRNLRSR
jgi:hypothetical protein